NSGARVLPPRKSELRMSYRLALNHCGNSSLPGDADNKAPLGRTSIACIAFESTYPRRLPVVLSSLISQPVAVFGPRGMLDNQIASWSSVSPNVLPYCDHSPRNVPV